MPDIAFVIFEEEKAKGKSRQGLLTKSGFFKLHIGTALLRIFNKKKYQNGINIFEIEPGTDILVIRLPFPPSMLTYLNRQYIERYISKLCSENGCKKCFVPYAVMKLGGFEQYTVDTNSRSVIFKALLMPILDEIYSKSGIRLDNLDTAFVNGEDTAELLTMVKQMEPFMRYINVAASDKGLVEGKLSDICADSGISIFVSSDFKSILRNADLVINLGTVSAISKYRIKPRSLVIDFFGEESPTLRGEFTLIKGMEYSFPMNQYNALGEDIKRSFSKAELTEILMSFKAGLLNEGSYNDTTAALVLKVFKNSCCNITGFKGRRGVLRVENVLKTVRM